MASATTTDLAGILMTLYDEGPPADLVYPQNPAFAMIPKTTNFGGDYKTVSVKVSNAAGLSSTAAKGIENEAPSVVKRFLVTRVKEYGFASLQNELIEAAAINALATVEAVKFEMDNTFTGVARRIGHKLFGDGSGAVGQIAADANLASTTLKLADPDDVVKFYPNQQIVFAANAASALRYTTTLTVLGRSESAGTILLSATPASLGGNVAVLDLIFTEGDYVSASDRLAVAGFGSWIPSADPTDTFFGVARTNYPTELGGHRLAGTTMQIDEALLSLAIQISRSGNAPDVAFVSHKQWRELQLVLGSRKLVLESNEVAGIGFEAIVLSGAPSGPIKVYADWACPNTVGWILTLKDWELAGLNGIPHILGLSADGKQIEWIDTDDAKRIRVGFYGNVCCWRPNGSGRVSLSIPT